MSPTEQRSANGTGAQSSDNELAQVLDEYLAGIEAGRLVDVDEWILRHPALADRLRTCLKGLHLVQEVAGAIGPLAPERTPSEGGPQLGDFEILRTLGRGGMGVVFEAVEHSLARHVALKVLPFGAAIDPRQLARFRVETQAAAQLHHTHIVPVYSVGCERGVHYYAMQLIDGPTLADVIADLRSSSSSIRSGIYFREIARLGLHAAEALEHAHQNGVLHRDIKPSNLMIDSRGHLWVTDFGLARFQGEGSLTETGDFVGTVRYMSPESAAGGASSSVVDQRTDVYSLGATLYELLTLEPAFEGSDRQDLLRRIADEEPKRPRGLNPAVPADLETIVQKAMAKDPVSRYSTAGALAEDLRRFLDDQPILARRPGPVERLARLARRHVRVVLTVLPLLVVMVIGLTAGIIAVLAKQSEILSNHAQIKQQKSEIERSRAEIRRQRDDNRRAYDDMYTQVAENWLGRQPSLQPLQRDFLVKALAHYEQASREPDADPEIRFLTGVASLRVGEIQRTLGKSDAAEHAYRRAIAILEPGEKGVTLTSDTAGAVARSYAGLADLLFNTGRADLGKQASEKAVDWTRAFVAITPQTPASRPLIAYHQLRLGKMLRNLGRLKEAEAAFAKAIELEKPVPDLNRLAEAPATTNLADLVLRSGRFGEAEQLYRRAVELHEALMKLEPGRPHYRENLAVTLTGLGATLAKRAGTHHEVERAFRRAAGLFDRLAADAPDVPAYRLDLAGTLRQLGTVLFSLGRLPEAEAVLRQPPAICEALVAEAPNVPGFREELAASLTDLARAQWASGRAAPALSNACRAQEIYDQLDSPGRMFQEKKAANLGCLGLLLAAGPRRAEGEQYSCRAVPIVEKLVANFPDDANLRSALAISLQQAAWFSMSTRPEQSERDYRRSLEIFEQLVKEAPERSMDRYYLAHVARSLGSLCLRNNRLEECGRFNRQAIDAYGHLISEDFRRAEMLRAGATCLDTLGMAQFGANNPHDAEQCLRRAKDLLDSLPADEAMKLETRDSRGKVLDHLGVILKATGRLDAAEPCLRQAQEIWEGLVAQVPSPDKYRSNLALSRMHLGSLLAERGDVAQARRLLTEAVELQKAVIRSNPRDIPGRAHLRGVLKPLALFLIDQRAHAEASAVVDDLLRSPANDGPETKSTAGRYSLLCALIASQDQKLPLNRREAVTRSYSERARDVLRQAADSGNIHGAMDLCRFLVIAPLEEFRDAALAAQLARQLIAKSPTDTDPWLLLGSALYRAGDWKGAVAAFDKGAELNHGKIDVADFFVAMAHWRLDHKEQARHYFDRCVGWLGSNQTDAVPQVIRAEAAALLGLPERGPPGSPGQIKRD